MLTAVCDQQEQAFTDVEMPGQYLGGAEVAPEAVVFLERIGSNVGIVRRHATSYRRLALHGSDGKTVHFLVQTGQHWSNTSGAHHSPHQHHLAAPSMSCVPSYTTLFLVFLQKIQLGCSSRFCGREGGCQRMCKLWAAWSYCMLRGCVLWAVGAGAADERMMQLLRNMNRLLDKHPQSRRRHLAWHTPIIVPVYPQVRPTIFTFLSTILLSLTTATLIFPDLAPQLDAGRLSLSEGFELFAVAAYVQSVSVRRTVRNFLCWCCAEV